MTSSEGAAPWPSDEARAIHETDLSSAPATAKRAIPVGTASSVSATKKCQRAPHHAPTAIITGTESGNERRRRGSNNSDTNQITYLGELRGTDAWHVFESFDRREWSTAFAVPDDGSRE